MIHIQPVLRSNEVDSVLVSIRAGNFATQINDIPEVYTNTSIEDVVRTLESERFVLLKTQGIDDDSPQGNSPDRIFGRIAFMKAAMKAFSKDQSISCIVDHMVAMETVGVDDTLDVVFKNMIASEKEEIFVFEKGTACGLITCQDIVSYLNHQEHVAKINHQILEQAAAVEMVATEVPHMAWLHQGSMINRLLERESVPFCNYISSS